MVRVLLTLIVIAIPGASAMEYIHAAPLTVINHSFETQVLANGTFDRGPLPSWASPADPSEDDSGTFNPTTASFPGEAPDGANVAFIGGSAFFVAQAITQTLSSQLMQGSYELRVDVGDRSDTMFAGYRIELHAGATVVAADNNSLVPANGEFVTSLVTFNALATNPNLGQPLAIRLLALNPGSQVQTDFDNVRLDFTSVPKLGDVNHDGLVNIFDINLVSTHWGESGPTADANHDGVINIFDINLISANWTAGPVSVPEPSTLVLAFCSALAASYHWQIRPRHASR